MSTDQARMLLLGTGRIAADLCAGIREVLTCDPQIATSPLRLVVAGRNRAAARAVAHLVEPVDAARLPGQASAEGVGVNLVDDEAVAELLRAIRPDLVVVCASLQPTRTLTDNNAWADLIRCHGLGLTVPLQADIALRVGRAMSGLPGRLVNACLPDLTNPVLTAAGVPVLAGLGNVGTLAAVAAMAHGIDEAGVALSAHHLHLHPPRQPADEARCWVGGEPVADVGTWLAPVRALPRRQLNRCGAMQSAPSLLSLLCGHTRDTHLPGVHGKPGGYPVRIRAGTIELRLPPGADLTEMDLWHRRLCELDGLRLERDGSMWLADGALRALRDLGFTLPDHFDVDRLAQHTRQLLDLRTALAQRPAFDRGTR